MSPHTCATSEDLFTAIEQEGFAFVHGAAMRDLLAPYGATGDWDTFAASWRDLALDTYMADGARYRRRRHGAFAATRDRGLTGKPHQAHFQTLDYNPLHGGIERWFEPIDPAVAASATLTTILTFCHALFGALAPQTQAWHVEVHQFRIEARPNEQGRPTPEGLHRDGVDYVLVLLVNRQNIASGMTTIHGADGGALGHFTLTAPCDAALVDDTRVAHGVTPVEAIDPAQPAFRDVLVVTFKNEDARGGR